MASYKGSHENFMEFSRESLGQLVEVSKDKENATAKKRMVQLHTSKDEINPNKKWKELAKAKKGAEIVTINNTAAEIFDFIMKSKLEEKMQKFLSLKKKLWT